MEIMTAEHARRLARGFLDLSASVVYFHIQHREGMSVEEDASLTQLDISLRDTSRQFSGLAGRLELSDLEATIHSVEEATKQAKTAIENIRNVADTIQRVTQVLALGEALMRPGAGSIAGAVRDLAAGGGGTGG